MPVEISCLVPKYTDDIMAYVSVKGWMWSSKLKNSFPIISSQQ